MKKYSRTSTTFTSMHTRDAKFHHMKGFENTMVKMQWLKSSKQTAVSLAEPKLLLKGWQTKQLHTWVSYLSRSLATHHWETAGMQKRIGKPKRSLRYSQIRNSGPHAISTLCLILILSGALEPCIP